MLLKLVWPLYYLGYPSPERVLILSKDPTNGHYGLGLPSKEAFSTADNDIYQIGKSYKQANKNLLMKVTATKPWELIHIEKSERYQLTATCDYSDAVLSKTLKTRDLLVPCLKRWNSQVIQPQGHKICYIRADNAGESTGVAYDDRGWFPVYKSLFQRGHCCCWMSQSDPCHHCSLSEACW